jgi:hypothetical protein
VGDAGLVAELYNEIVIVFKKKLKIFGLVVVIIPRSRSDYYSF